LRLRQRKNAAAFYLSVTGFTNPPIGEALAVGAFHRSPTRMVSEAYFCTAIVTKIELGKVAVKMGFTAMLVSLSCGA
jgi:hypothetical protein